jgi:hypothetical protein
VFAHDAARVAISLPIWVTECGSKVIMICSLDMIFFQLSVASCVCIVGFKVPVQVYFDSMTQFSFHCSSMSFEKKYHLYKSCF